MRRKPRPNKQIVAFKVEPELAALLDAMPNKSEFIRNAVARQLSTACPLCRGTGITPYSGISDELTRLVQQHPLCVCAGCGVKVPRPCHTPGHCEEEPRHRVVRAMGRLLLRGLRAHGRFLRRLPQSHWASRRAQEARVRRAAARRETRATGHAGSVLSYGAMRFRVTRARRAPGKRRRHPGPRGAMRGAGALRSRRPRRLAGSRPERACA